MKKFIVLSLFLVSVYGLTAANSATAKDRNRGPEEWHRNASSAPVKIIKRLPPRNPVVVGKITAITDNTITVVGQPVRIKRATTSATSTYTVDASNAIIIRGNATTTINGLVVGDQVTVRGTLNGTNVKASIIHTGVNPLILQRELRRLRDDNGRSDDYGLGWKQQMMASNTSTTSTTSTSSYPIRSGFFRRVGQYFTHLFGR